MIALGISIGVASIVAFISVFILVQDIYRMQASKRKSPVERPHFFAQVAELFTRTPELPASAPASSTEVEMIDVDMSQSTTSTSTIQIATPTNISTSTPQATTSPSRR